MKSANDDIVVIEPDHPFLSKRLPVWMIHARYGHTKDGRFLAIAYATDELGSVVLDVEVFPPDGDQAAVEWFERVRVEQPWLGRSQ